MLELNGVYEGGLDIQEVGSAQLAGFRCRRWDDARQALLMAHRRKMTPLRGCTKADETSLG
jgi:hypothetical protein